MDHAQSICPTGMGPYGRMTETFTFEPDRECGGTYSGRHGPYYIASLICGGPELYTKNSRIMYGEGPIGGCDQGHSSETLSHVGPPRLLANQSGSILQKHGGFPVETDAAAPL